jgi:hypothetical protein
MKINNKVYTDVTKVTIDLIDKKIAKEMIIKNHYTHKWTSCRYALGVFMEKKLIGCLIYGFPVGRQTVKSIISTLNNDEVLELTRLWIADGFGCNIESYSIGLTFKWLKNNAPKIKVLISYADPMAGHLGKIYQATNWLYQGNKTMLIKGYIHVIFGEKMHPRSVVAKYKSIKEEVLLKIDPNYKRIFMENKHRYIYILNKSIKIKQLKHPILDYPKFVEEASKKHVK